MGEDAIMKKRRIINVPVKEPSLISKKEFDKLQENINKAKEAITLSNFLLDRFKFERRRPRYSSPDIQKLFDHNIDCEKENILIQERKIIELNRQQFKSSNAISLYTA